MLGLYFEMITNIHAANCSREFLNESLQIFGGGGGISCKFKTDVRVGEYWRFLRRFQVIRRKVVIHGAGVCPIIQEVGVQGCQTPCFGAKNDTKLHGFDADSNYFRNFGKLVN